MDVILDSYVHCLFTYGTYMQAAGEKFFVVLQTTTDPAFPDGQVLYLENPKNTPVIKIGVAGIKKPGSHDCQIMKKGPSSQASYQCSDGNRIAVLGRELATDPKKSLMIVNRHDLSGSQADYLVYTDATTATPTTTTLKLAGKIPPNVGI